MAAYYQFFREGLFALVKGGTFVLLVDARNPAFFNDGPAGRRGQMPFLETFVPERHRGRVGAVTVQRVVGAIERSGRHGDWIGEYKAR